MHFSTKHIEGTGAMHRTKMIGVVVVMCLVVEFNLQSETSRTTDMMIV